MSNSANSQHNTSENWTLVSSSKRNHKRNRNESANDSPPQVDASTKKKRGKSKTPPSDKHENVVSKVMSDFESCGSNDPENMEDVFERLLRESERRTLNLIKDEIRETVKDEITKLREELRPVFDLSKTICDVEEKVEHLRKQTQRLDKSERRYNIVVHGLHEKDKETYQDRDAEVKKLARTLKLNVIDYSEAKRIGSMSNRKPRPMLIELIRYRDKAEILSRWTHLKGSGITIADDLTKEERRIKAILIEKKKEIQNTNRKAQCSLRDGSLQVWDGVRRQRFIVNMETWRAEEQQYQQRRNEPAPMEP
jgi:hypothetical protein